MNQINFGDQRLQIPGQFYSYPSPVGASDDWWRRGQQAANTARTRQAYAAGANPPNAPRASQGFTAGGRINRGTVAHSLANLDHLDTVFLLGSAPFTYANYKSFGATNPQALIGTVGTEGGGVLGGLAGARLGATLGAPLGPWGAPGGAILGAVIGGQTGFRLGSKAADEISGLGEVNRMRQQQQFYDPATGEVYMPPPPLTPEQKIQQQIFQSSYDPYREAMMYQLGGAW